MHLKFALVQYDVWTERFLFLDVLYSKLFSPWNDASHKSLFSHDKEVSSLTKRCITPKIISWPHIASQNKSFPRNNKVSSYTVFHTQKFWPATQNISLGLRERCDTWSLQDVMPRSREGCETGCIAMFEESCDTGDIAPVTHSGAMWWRQNNLATTYRISPNFPLLWHCIEVKFGFCDTSLSPKLSFVTRKIKFLKWYCVKWF